tara:strand:- start:82837 stop:83604 length:768 start_codon:yes stop_codon:yes gene_type:complete
MKSPIALLILLFFTSSAWASGTQCVAHRGNSSEFPENSREAILSAVEIGSHAVEFDIRHSSDGVPFVIHDKTLERTVIPDLKGCPTETLVSLLPIKMIRDNCLLPNFEPIPTLDEILNDLKETEVTLFIEYKDEPSLLDVQIIQKYFSRSPKKIFIISFKTQYLEKFKFWRNRHPFLNSVRLLKINRFGTRYKKKFDGVDSKLLTKRMVKKLHKNNKTSAVWTIDKEKKMKRYIKKDVQFITTNKPKLCLDLVSQ